MGPQGKDGFGSLTIETSSLPPIGEFDVLVKICAVSLNFRDLMIAKGIYYWPIKDEVVPVPTQTHIAGTMTLQDAMNNLGGLMNGGLREYAAYNENGLVEIPASLSYREGATLPCAALTAWNALYGAKPLRAGETVVTLGTGGVNMFAIQFALASGAQVIATTSSDKKGEVLKKLGVHHVINYKKDINWGMTAKNLSLGGRGADYVLEISGPNTMEQSCNAAAIDGVVAIIGTRGGNDGAPTLPHIALVTTRRIMIGSRLQFEEMNRAIEVNKIKPVIDSKVFKFNEAREAFQYLWDQNALGKVVIEID
ncbi:hypothetical protein B7463_g4444, partial [Scytalidium lignicola]